MDFHRGYGVQLPEGAMPSPGTAGSSSRTEAPTTLPSPTPLEAMAGNAGMCWEHQFNWMRSKISCLEDQLHMARRDRSEAELRARHINEQVDRLWQEIADERRERQVEANEERMLRLADSAEIREGLGRVKAAQVEPRFRDCSDPVALETFVEESEEREDEQAPELTALEQEDDGKGHRRHYRASAASSEGISEAALSAARHAEAQLKRAAADARRAEAMVRREVARAVAEARVLIEDNGQQQQEFWAARQRLQGIAGNDASSGKEKGTPQAASVECLGLRLDSLEMHLRARLEAAERGFDALQSAIDDVQNMPAQVDGLIRQEIDAVRIEMKETFNAERSHSHARAQALVRDLSNEIEQSVIQQAVAEVRADVVAAVQAESNILREDLVRARSDEASRMNMRFHALEERVGNIESNRTKVAVESDGSAGGSANGSRVGSHNPDPAPAVVLQQFGEHVAQLESTIAEWGRKQKEQQNENQADNMKLRKEIEDVSRRVNRMSASEMADLQQRFELMEDKLRHEPQPRLHAESRALTVEEASKTRLVRLEEAVEQQGQVVKATKRCISDVLHRLSSTEEDAVQSLSKTLPSMIEHLDDCLNSGNSKQVRSAVNRSLSEEPAIIRAQTSHTPLVPMQGGSLGQLPPGTGHCTPLFPGAQTPGNSLASGSHSVQIRPEGPVPSPGVPYSIPQASVALPPYGNGVQRTWSVPVLRNPPDSSALSTTVKVVPPGSGQVMSAVHRSPSLTSMQSMPKPGTPVASQASTPYTGSLAAPAAPSATAVQLRPSSMPRAVSPMPGPPSMQSGPNPRMQKPTDSPYLRHRPVRIPASPTLPGRPVMGGRY
eukprot:gb/GFBE01038515.1/.p1 GENE.gb/GFBE01038515.1/~~gb/GFBE01038515.1/.p1  ORF type:complete len:838 (+),score=173.35 gb/GFBE01038515.1/:1-2514(+)